MKIAVAFAFIILGLFSCTQDKPKDPKAIALIAFDKILNAQEKDFEYYENKTANRNDILNWIEHNKVSDTIIKFIRDSLTDKKIKAEKEIQFNQLKEELIGQNIICNKAQFIGFTYKYDDELFTNALNGVLYFSYEKKIYKVKFVAMKMDDYFKLVSISDVGLKSSED